MNKTFAEAFRERERMGVYVMWEMRVDCEWKAVKKNNQNIFAAVDVFIIKRRKKEFKSLGFQSCGGTEKSVLDIIHNSLIK